MNNEIKNAKELAAARAEEMIKKAEGSHESHGKDSEAVKPSTEEHQQLKKQVEELLALKDRWLRQAADYANAKKRLQKERDDFMKFANENVIGGVLLILRDLDRVVHHGQKQNQQKDPVVAGVELVIKQFEKFLETSGVKRIESVGKTFDPHIHEAVNHISSDQAAETVLEEVEPGYFYHDRLLKPAKVVVSSGPAAAKT